MNVAQAMVSALVQEGVRVAAGITGESIEATADAICSQPEIRVCYARHERGAVDIADGYGRVTGEPAVVFADAGPGVGNAMAGILQAFGDSTPLIFVASQRQRLKLGLRGYKECPVKEVFGPITKWTTNIDDPSQVAPTVRRAFTALRSGRSGPVVLGLPVDVSRMPVSDFAYQPLAKRFRSAGDPEDVERAVQLLAEAKQPYLYVGAGVLLARATDRLAEFADLLSIPVGTTLNGKSAFPENHPLSLGIGGFPRALFGSKHATEYAYGADVVLALGCGFREQATKGQFPEGVKLIQVDVDASEVNKHCRADVAIIGDARLVLEQLIEAARSVLPAQRLGRREDVLQKVAHGRAEWLEFSRPFLTSAEKPINPFRVTWEFRQLVDPAGTIVLHDAGSTRGAVSQHYEATTPRGFLGMGVQSAMGWSLGAAIGAKVAAPEKLVAAFLGDEAFGETAMEVDTSVRAGAPILAVLMNNVRVPDGSPAPPFRSQLHRYRHQISGDYCALARSLGAEAWRIEDPNSLSAGLARAVETVRGGRTTVVEVITRRMSPMLFPL